MSAIAARVPARSRPWIWALRLVAVIVVLNLLAGAVDRVFHQRGGPDSSSLATAPKGLAAYSELVARSGHPVSTLRRPIERAALDPRATVVLLDPDAVSPRAASALRSFVARGGTLVGGGIQPAWLRLVDRSLPDWTAEGAKTARPSGARSPLLAGVRELRSAGDGSWHLDRSTPARALAGSPKRALVADMTIGRGRAILLADPSPLQNRLLDNADNAVLGVNAAGPRGRPVVFAESVHGYGEKTGFAAIPRSWKWALAGLAIAALVYMAARARRLGPPEEESRELPPPRREFVDAVAGGLERSGDPSAGAAPVRAAALERLTRRAALGDDPGEPALREAGRRFGLADDELGAIVAPRGDEADAIAAGRALAKLSTSSKGVS